MTPHWIPYPHLNQVEALEQLSAALEELREAERGYQLPSVMNASVQVIARLSPPQQHVSIGPGKSVAINSPAS